MKNRFKRIIPGTMAFMMLLSVCITSASAFTVGTRSSGYLDSYSAYCYAIGHGQIDVYVFVEGTGKMDKIGASKIYIEKSSDNKTWKTVKTFTAEDNPNFMDSNAYTYENHAMTYQGTGGYWYRA